MQQLREFFWFSICEHTTASLMVKGEEEKNQGNHSSPAIWHHLCCFPLFFPQPLLQPEWTTCSSTTCHRTRLTASVHAKATSQPRQVTMPISVRFNILPEPYFVPSVRTASASPNSWNPKYTSMHVFHIQAFYYSHPWLHTLGSCNSLQTSQEGIYIHFSGSFQGPATELLLS